jgi:hypothetical protein
LCDVWPQESCVSSSFHADVRCGGGDDDDDARFGFLRWRGVFVVALIACFFPTNKFDAALGGLCLLGRGFGWALLFPEEGFWEEKGSFLLYGCSLSSMVEYGWVLNGVVFPLVVETLVPSKGLA